MRKIQSPIQNENREYCPGDVYEHFLREKERWQQSDDPLAVLLRKVNQPKKFKGVSIFNRLLSFG